MPPQHENRALLKELEDHNAFFDSIVDMIPAKLYVAGNSGDDGFNTRYFRGQNKESKEAKRARIKAAKRAKYDPEKAETTRQTKERLAKEADEAEKKEFEQSDEVEKEELPETPAKQELGSRIEALREKLHAKLAEKRSQRPTDPNTVSKRAARRAEKQRRQEEAKKRKASSKTQVKDKRAPHFSVKDDSEQTTPATDLANLDFGKLTGLNSNPKDYANNKSLANMNKKKNLEKMLADAEKKQQRLEDLKRGSEEDKAKAAKMQWSDALKEADGERIKDDPAKLKKTMKRKMAKKAKSAKAWKSRMEQTKQKMDDRQKIRSHNLDKRKMGGSAGANLSKKRIVDEEDSEPKKGRRQNVRAGFEGKKHDFINDKGKVQ